CRSKRAKWQSFPTAASDVEAFAASAVAANVRVVELEAFVEAFLDEVQFGTVDVDQALGIDEDLHAVAFEDLVAVLHLIDELKHVGQPRAAGGTDAQTDTLALAAPLQGTL